ncbi:MAG: metallophosphoesterase [Nocardioides sp.]|uniref:metallophosphoesterase family protein n=1 Tax=Nocardioides sp. TaxID=35761 RepID=UPI0039E33B8C
MTRILHLSDPHVPATGPDMDGVDAIGSLERILHDVRHVPDLDLIVVSGDIADDGSAAGCEAVRERVGAFAAERGIPHVYSTGNHDDRDAFAAALGTGHLGAGGADRGTLLDPDGGTRAAVSDLGGLRVVTLDSLVPGQGHGVIGERQLAALATVLASSAPRGTVLAFHHPPLRIPAIPYAERAVLQDIDALADVVRGTDVRVILTGHLHLQASGFLAGVPVWVTPGIVTRIDTSAAPGIVRGVLGASASVVDLSGDSSGDSSGDGPTFHVIHARDPRAGEEVYAYDALTGQDVTEPA